MTDESDLQLVKFRQGKLGGTLHSQGMHGPYVRYLTCLRYGVPT